MDSFDNPSWFTSTTVLSPRYPIHELSEEAQAHAYAFWDAIHHAPIEVFLVDCAANGKLFTEQGNLVYSETQRTNLLVNHT